MDHLLGAGGCQGHGGGEDDTVGLIKDGFAMKIALIQQRATEDRADNRRRGLAAVVEAAAQGARIVCFAELAFEPFYPQEVATSAVLELAEPIPGPTTKDFAALAADLGVVIVLNLFERDVDRTYDSSPVIDADGRVLGTTRMVHITEYTCFHEQGYYAQGDRGAPVYETAYGKIGVAICYDRHYPEYMRALALGGAEVVCVPQAGAVGEWPAGLYEAEMQVAAFQNGYFTALCNRVGPEPNLTFAGESFVCDPAGRVIARARQGTEEILHCDLDLERVKDSHARRMFLRDRRPELYGDWLT
jgi:N-carbamoylputrescine amidase